MHLKIGDIIYNIVTIYSLPEYEYLEYQGKTWKRKIDNPIHKIRELKLVATLECKFDGDKNLAKDYLDTSDSKHYLFMDVDNISDPILFYEEELKEELFLSKEEAEKECERMNNV